MLQAENKHYVIRALGQEKETLGGIIVQNTGDSELAEIVSAGPQVEKPLAVGTHIAVNWGSVAPVTLRGNRYFVIHADNILASITNE